MRSTPKFLMLAAMAVSTAWLSGCFLGSENSGPTTEDVKASDKAALSATGNLETSVANMQKGSYEYGKEDLTSLKSANSDFKEAARLNPGNSKAQLGMAVTGVLLAAQSQKLSSIINRTVEGKSPFDSRVSEEAPAKRAAVLRQVAEAATWPEFHEIQDAIADTMLPALDDAIARLKVVYDDPAFSMMLVIEGEPRELDHVEVGVLLAGLHAIKGLLTLWLSYDIDIDYNGSYDWIEALDGLDNVEKFSDLTQAQRDALNKGVTILSPTSPFLAVRPAWKSRLAGVDDEIKSALDILKASVVSLGQETDPQANDLLHLCVPGEEGACMDPDDYQEAKDVIDTARKYMSQPYEVRLADIDTTIKVNFAALFNVQDYKKFMPYYGFYNANEWSDTKPVLYFTNKSGTITGNIMTLKDIADQADANNWTAVQVVDAIRAVIHLQDPTFQNYLPGATEADIWNLIRKQAQYDDENNWEVAMAKRAVGTMKPGFALSLLGK